ncbi:MAG: hypothetical protein NC517_13145 [Firmicutes bacterium]|nr:hypothetical protein [Bacillota bacterium]
MGIDEVLWDEIYKIKYLTVILGILDAFSLVLCLMLIIGGEPVGAVCSGILCGIILVLMILFGKKKKKLEAAFREYQENLRKL